MTYNDIPADIRDALDALPWAENGVLWGLRFSKTHMWNHSHIIPDNMARQQGIVQRDGGNYVLLHDGAGIDPVAVALPAIGQPVLQVHRTKRIVRTSRVRRVVVNSNFPILDLEPYGPAAGTPIGGDSGSLFFARDAAGKPVVLGMAIYEGWLSFGRPGVNGAVTSMSEEESRQAMDDILSTTSGGSSVPGPSGPASASGTPDPARPEPTPEPPPGPAPDVAEYERQIADLRAQIGELLTENETLNAQLDAARTDLAETSARLDKLITARNALLNG